MSEDEMDHMSRARFFDLLRGLPSGDLTQIQLAYWLAKNAHRPQAGRENGERYFEHPRRVAVSLVERGLRHRDLVTLALLHDIVEDTNTPPQFVVDVFPNVIWDRLYLLSKYVPVFNPITGQLYDRTKKPVDMYFKAIAAADADVRLVKLADRYDNLSTMDQWTPERKKRYLQETREHIVPIAEATDPWFYQQILRALEAAER